MATTEINKTKILVKVHEPLIAIMQHKMEAACLKRDAYLDKALRVEAEFLRKEIATPNSDKAKNYIAAQLGDLKLKPLNLLLSTETVDLINEVCKEKNVPRDAFMNRFFLLLIASDTILSALFREFFSELSCKHDLTNRYHLNYRGIGDLNYIHFTEDEEGRIKNSQDGIPVTEKYDERERWSDLLGVYWLDHHLDVDGQIWEASHPNEHFGVAHPRTYFHYNDYMAVTISANGLEAIEELVTSNPFSKIRGFLNHIAVAYEILPQYQQAMYSYPFPKISLQNLPEGYDDLEAKNCIGFNTFMTDEQLEILENLDAKRDSYISEKRGDKLLAVMQKEKQARTEKTKQSLVEKAKSAGEEK
jgi:hypothetical protein